MKLFAVLCLIVIGWLRGIVELVVCGGSSLLVLVLLGVVYLLFCFTCYCCAVLFVCVDFSGSFGLCDDC